MENKLTGDRERSGLESSSWLTGLNHPSRAAIRVHTDGGNADRLLVKPGNVE